MLLSGLEPGKSPASGDPTSPEAAPLIELVKAGTKTSRKNDRQRERWPSDLPVTQQIVEPEEVVANPSAYRCIGQEVSEQLDYEPAKFFRRQIIRRKYVSVEQVEAAPVIAPLPANLQERCVAAPGLLAQIVVSKYCDHLPLYRQQQIYWERHQVWLPRASQARWIGLVAFWLRPIYQQIKEELMSEDYVQVDETPIKYLAPGKGKAAQGYLWTATAPGADVLFEWHTSRAASCLEELIAQDFSGTLQCDGYVGYDRFAKRRFENGQQLCFAGCWAHVRRAFFEALDSAPRQAGWILLQIGHLYEIERHLRQARAGPSLREAIRCAQSRPIHERIGRVLKRWHSRRRILPKSSLGKAISYALGQWESLAIYLHDGTIEIDNNCVENAIRPTAIGKKNWLFFGDAQAGERSAILYTIIESCRRRGVQPYAYLLDVLTRLPTMTNQQISTITPRAWAAAQKPATPKAA